MITWKNMQRRYPFNSQPGIEKGTPEFSREILMADTLRMNETLINNWNSVVGKNDLVYHLGDLAFASANKIREIVERLNGNIHLIPGNHEKWKVLKNMKDLFVGIDNYKEINYQYNGETYHICMFHHPISPNCWNRSHYDSIHAHGHSHGAFKGFKCVEKEIMEIFTELNLTNQQKVAYLSRLNLNNGKMVDVGVDTDLANFYPILMEDLIDYTKVLNYTKNVDL